MSEIKKENEQKPRECAEIEDLPVAEARQDEVKGGSIWPADREN